MGRNGRQLLGRVVASTALVLGTLGATPALAVEPPDGTDLAAAPEVDPATLLETEDVPAELVDAVRDDLGMTWEEFVGAGAAVEAAAQDADAGDGQVLVLTDEGVVGTSPEALGAEGSGTGDGDPGHDGAVGFADLEALRESYVREVGVGGLSGLAITLDGYEVLVADPDDASDRGREDTTLPLVSPAEWGRAHGVTVTAASGDPRPAATLRGGSPVTFGGAACTHGFNGWYQGRSTGIAAGHCVTMGGREVRYGSSYVGTSDWWQFGAPGSGWETYGTDLATYPVSSSFTTPAEIRSGSGSLTITGRASAVLGMPVCKMGRVTGWTCARATKIGWQWIGDGSGDFNRPKRWVWSLFADLQIIPGDSGGPWVAGRKAVGVSSSYDYHADGSSYSTAALLTSLDEYRPGAQVKMWLGRARIPSATFTDSSTARARWSQGQTVSGSLSRHSGDSVSPGTIVDVSVDGTRVASPQVAADGSFSLTYPGSDSARHTVTFRARNGDSRGPLVTVEDQPAGVVPTVVRLAGTNRYGTAAAIARQSWPSGADTVFVASGENFPDALSGGALAGSQDAPVLLTKGGSLTGVTRDAIVALGPERIVVLGGSEAVSWGVQRSLAEIAPVTRISGGNRYEVAANVVATYASADTVYVASGEDYPDALTAAPRAGGTDQPMLLTKKGFLPQAAIDELERLSPRRIIIMGGTEAVGSGVERTLQGHATTVVRMDGTNRYEVSARLARLYPSPSPVVWVARGDGFADALAAAPAAAKRGVPVVITRPDSLSSVTRTAIQRLEPPRIHVTGGVESVSRAIFEELRWMTFP